MKSTINTISSLILLMIAITGCSKSDLLMYQEDPRVYFVRSEVIEYTFSVKPTTLQVDTLYIPVRIMGSATKQDRTFALKVEDSSTAKLGYHFRFGPLVIPANTYEVSLPVYLTRRPGLKDSVVVANITIGETADFKPGYIDKSIGINPLDKLHYRITINDQLLKPGNWDTYWINYFGAYSKVKFQFLIQSTGKISWNSSPLPQDLNFIVQTARLALYNYEQANGPMFDENGTRVVFP